MVWLPRVTVCEPVSGATAVLRQKRSLAKAAEMTGEAEPRLTRKRVPSSAFSGRPPSAGGLKVGSRQVPVHVGGSCGSSTWTSSVSLYDISVRYGVFEPSTEFCQRVFQKEVLPANEAMLTPASRAFSRAVRSPADQYSSWPELRITLWLVRRVDPRSTSTLVM